MKVTLKYPLRYGREVRVENLPVSVRTKNALQRAGCTTVGDIETYGINEILNVRGIGDKTYAELCETLCTERTVNDNAENG